MKIAKIFGRYLKYKGSVVDITCNWLWPGSSNETGNGRVKV